MTEREKRTHQTSSWAFINMMWHCPTSCVGIRAHTSVDKVGERFWNPQGHRGDGLGKQNPQATAHAMVGVRSNEDEDAVFLFPFS